MNHSLLAQPTRGRLILAAAAVLGVIIFSSIATAPQANASPISIAKSEGFVAFSARQPNLERCVGSVVGLPVLASPGKSAVRTATIDFAKANTCEGVQLTVTTVDKSGRLSAGTLDPLPLGAQTKVVVNFTGGDARKENTPMTYLSVS